MTDTQQRVLVYACGGSADVPERACLTRYPAVSAVPPAGLAGGPRVNRYLPSERRRLVGGVCLVDEIGPLDVGDTPWNIATHPHMGLQILTYQLRGQLEQRDSLGNVTLLEPGQFSMFNSGRGASHLERSPQGATGPLHAVQLWIVLPERQRAQLPRQLHITKPHLLNLPGVRATVLIGNLAGVGSPLGVASKVVAAVVTIEPGAGLEAAAWLPLNLRYEYAVVPLSGDFTLNDQAIRSGALHYLGWHRDGVDLSSGPGAQFLLLGGEPFTEEFQLWWNLAASRYEELVSARTLWNAHAPRFGTVPGGTVRATTPLMPPRRAQLSGSAQQPLHPDEASSG